MKVIKGVGKAVKGLVKGVKKVFKKITDSKIGKALLIAATIYFGGAALGAWNSPFASVNGAWTQAGSMASRGLSAKGTAAVASSAPVVESAPAFVAGGGDVAGATVANAATGGAAAGNTAAAANTATNAAKANSLINQATGNGIPGWQGGGATGGSAAASNEVSKGIVNRLLNGAQTRLQNTKTWAKDNPILAATGLNAVAGAMSPDELDIIEQRRKWDEDDRKRRERNLDVTGIDLRIQPRFTPSSLAPKKIQNNGIIAGNMSRAI